MVMDRLYEQLLLDMEVNFDKLSSQVPPPQPVSIGRGRFVFRYKEQTAQQALIQKLARIITGLRAARVLLKQGLLQEQAVIARVVDELHEDVLFLSYGILKGQTKNHESFLVGFYQEEFDNPDSAFDSTQKRPTLSREKIRAYLARIEGASGNPSDNQEQLRTLSKTLSGFVHGASPQIMDMYIGHPPCFHVRGMLGTFRMAEYEFDIWNYFYRGFMAFGFAAKAFGDEQLFQAILVQKRNFETQSGRGE